MKTVIFMQKSFAFFKGALCIAVCALCPTALANADNQTSQDESNKAVDLLLTLPNQWLPAGISSVSDRQKSPLESNKASEQNNDEIKKSSRIDVGCNLNVDENVSVVSSVQRVGGDCKLNYHY